LGLGLVEQNTRDHGIAKQYEDEVAHQFSEERGRHILVLLLV
jgi:hypothetical protein